MLNIKENKYQLSYCIAGKGKPLVCIHGLNLDHRMFEYGNLKKKFPNNMIIAFDLPGYCNSKPMSNLDFNHICNLIIMQLESLKIKKFVLCGYCMGGAFALNIIRLYPNRVEKLYMLETMLIYPRWLELTKTRLFEKGYNFMNKHNIAKILSLVPPLKEFTSENRSLFCDRVWHRDINRLYLNMLREMHIEEYKDFLSKLNVDCVIVIASNTYNEVFETASFLQRYIKQTTLCIIRDKGHLFFL